MIMKTKLTPLFCSLVLASALTAFAAPEKVSLWPEGKIPDFQEKQIAAPTDVAGKPDFKPEEWRMPYLEWSEPPAESNRNDCCLILISGGSYINWCDVGLVEGWRRRFTAEGFQCVKLVYRTPRPEGLEIYRTAWQDGQRAVRLVRLDAAKRGYDPKKIGTVSMSAGSHLATLLATSALTPAYERVNEVDDTPCHINWAITCAIAFGMSDGLTGPNTTVGNATNATLDTCFKFDDKTAPMCMFHGGKDPYSPISSTQVYRRLRQKKIPAELHLFADRGHGFFGSDQRKEEEACAYDTWFDRAMEFMRQMGFLGELPPEKPLMARFPNDDDRASYEKQDLWPAGRIPDLQTNQCIPFIEWHAPKDLKTKAIQIIYSGGAYQGNNPNGAEVAPARRFLNAHGMTVVTLNYRTPRPAKPLGKHVTAWQDLQRAIRLVRSQAEARGLDPDRIGIMGSSAGGHLTLMGAASSQSPAYEPIDELDKLSCKVHWGIAIYPAYGLTDGVDCGNSTGGNADSAVLVPEFAFDEDTPPMLFVHGDADGWAAMNSVKAWEQLRRMGIQSDLHTLVRRGHCFQFKAAPGTGSYTWLGRIWEFMNHMGFNK